MKNLPYVLLAVALLFSSFQHAGGQGLAVSGTVTDETDTPLAGVAVTTGDGYHGVTTDSHGNYSIRSEQGGVLTFSFIGYRTRTVRLGGDTRLDVKMEPVSQAIDDVVVVGYGVQKKANLTGSVSTVSFTGEMASRPTANASSALAGLSAGVQVQQGSGKPGSDGGTIRVRGTGTLNSNNPLVLVDGIEWDMNNVNPQDIESITILKDAASASIYGSRAANGVILVTTKKGQGRPGVNYSFYGSIEVPQNKLALISDYAEHMELINEGAENMGKALIFGQSTIDAWRQAKLDPNGLNEYGMPNYMAYPNTDWFNEIMGRGFSQQHNLSVSGSSDRVSYLVSFGYLDKDGVMNKKNMNSGMERFQFRTNLEAKITDWISVGTRLNGLKQAVGMTNISRAFEYLNRTTPGIWPGEPNKWGQPAAVEESTNANNVFYMMGREGHDKMDRINATLYGIIRPFEGLSIEASYNYAPDFGDYATWGFQNGTWNYVQDISVSESSLENATISNQSFRRTRKNSEILARYGTTFASDHELNLLAGFSTSYYKERSFQVARRGMSDWNLTQLNTATELSTSSSSEFDWALVSYFGRLNYAYMGRYLFEANLRYDGSSRFSPDSRWGIFPSFSAGWRISEEEFMASARSWLSNLKVQGSWGKLGNNSSGNYDWQASYSTNRVVLDGNPLTGLAVTKLGNTLLKWESTTTANIGLDFGLFRHRLTGELDVYDKLTDGILFTPSIPLAMGNITGATENIARVTNKGVELSLAWRDQAGSFSYGAGGNFSFNHNRVKKYKGRLEKYWTYDAEGNPLQFVNNYGDVAQSGFSGIILEGRMLGEMYLRDLYRGTGSYDGVTLDINAGPRDGMIRTESDMAWVRAMIDAGYTFNGINVVAKDQLWYGDLIYADLNGDGNYGDTNDQNLTRTSALPKYNFGFNFSAAWKGFDFYMLWAGSAGFHLYWNHSQYNGTQTENGYSIGRRVARNHYFYDPDNPSDPRTNTDAKYPRITDMTQRHNGLSSVYWRYKGDYIKLKNIQLGYTLPKRITRAFMVENMRVYVSAENLFTITSFPGLDPEIGTSVGYPLIKQVAFGAQITF